jgi:4-amino-4-deoxy-L-arabinose transferase-like glycosyltransferase
LTVKPRRPSSFAAALGSIAAAALAIRVAAAFWYDANTTIGGDAIWYRGVAEYLAHGQGFFNLYPTIATHHLVPTAIHPPLFPSYLATMTATGNTSTLALRLWCAMAGVLTVVLLGLVGRRLGGDRVGLLAAGIGAVFVDLWAQDVGLWSEGLFALTLVLTVFAAYAFIARPDRRHALLLGGAIALAALTRAEAVALYVILLPPLTLRARQLPFRRRLDLLVSALAIGAVLFAPWVAYNAGRFEHPVLVSNGFGDLIASSNCPLTYNHGPVMGGWGFVCLPETRKLTPGVDETVADRIQRRAGLRYIRHHAERLPVVIPVRVARSFGFYRPISITGGDLYLEANQHQWMPWIAMIQYWTLLVLGIAGLVSLRRRAVPLLPFLATASLVVIISVMGYGTMRFRIAVDAVLPVLAAIGAQAFWRMRHHAVAVERPSTAPRALVDN